MRFENSILIMFYGIDVAVLVTMIIISAIAVLVGSYPSLIAGYQDGNLPEKDEKQLITDVRIVLAGVVVGLIPLLIQNRIDSISTSVATSISLVVSLLLAGWLIWKYSGSFY